MKRALMIAASALALAGQATMARADSCWSEQELRDFSILIADRASELLYEQCMLRFAEVMRYSRSNRDVLLDRFDTRRDAAYRTVVGKFFPFLAGTSITKGGMVDKFISQWALYMLRSDLNAEACNSADTTMEALLALDEDTAIDIVAIYVRRGVEWDERAGITPCTAREGYQ